MTFRFPTASALCVVALASASPAVSAPAGDGVPAPTGRWLAEDIRGGVIDPVHLPTGGSLGLAAAIA